MSRIFWRVFIFLSLCSTNGMAQLAYLPFNNYTNRYGLNEKFVYTCTQDARGYIWIGASSGLYRFDGFEFKKFKSNADIPGHQIGNILLSIYPEKDGQLLLSSINSFQKYDPVKQVFKTYSNINPSLDKLINQDKISCFYRDSKNNLWVGTANNYWCLFDDKKYTLQYPKNINETSPKRILYITEIKDGSILVVAASGIYILYQTGEIKEQFAANVQQIFTAAFYDSKRNSVWIATDYQGMVQFDLNTQKYLAYPTSKPFYATSAISKNDSEIWLGGYELGIFNIRSKKYETIASKINDEYAFKTTKIAHLHKDKEGNLWIASHFGLAQLAWQNNQIQTIPLQHPSGHQTIEPLETIEIPDSEDLLIANNTSRGLIRWHAKGNCFSEIVNPKNQDKNIEFNGMVCIHTNAKGKIYCGDEKGLYTINKELNTIEPIEAKDQNGKPIGMVYHIISDNEHQLYLFSPGNGFYIYNTDNNQLTHYSSAQIQKYIGVNNRKLDILPALVDTKQNVWFVNTNGVLCFRPQDKHFIAYAQKPATNNGAKIIQSYSICEDKKGHYWISTVDNGIYELSIANNKESLINFNTSTIPALPSDYCKDIICDKMGKLWIGSLGGLFRWNPNNYKVESILTRQNGLWQNGFDVAIDALPHNKLVINNYGALNIVATGDYIVNSNKARICWEQFKSLDKIIPITSDSASIRLNYNENYIQFRLSFLSFNNSNQNEFVYKLEGVDQQWITSKNNEMVYAKLSEGDYTFLAKGINNDGVASSNTLKLNIHIAAPFWKTWWFYTAIALLIGLIVYLIYRYRIQQIRKEEALKVDFNKRIANVEMQALRAQMNPHFIFNSLNSIQKYILRNDSFEASQYLTKFSKLIRLFLDQSKQNYTPLSSEIEMLQLYIEIESLRFDNAFNYKIEIDKAIDAERIFIPSMLIQPYVENAIWHGLLHKNERGSLLVQISNDEYKSVIVTIEDDGVGRAKAHELKSKQVLKTKSYGTQITQDRIEILNKMQEQKASVDIVDLFDSQQKATGTKVVLHIPVTKQEVQ